MEISRGNQRPQKGSSSASPQPRKRGKLPCGSRVCLRCHKGCGVVMAAYLGGLDEGQEIEDKDR
jgi:hypothetical protein